MIRFATVDDIPSIMSFIDTYWRKDHIMARDRSLFDFQHVWDSEVSFVISENFGHIDGLLGFIPYAQDDRDITLAIWKTIKTSDTMIGLSILRFLRENGKIHSMNAPGINKKTQPIYKFLGYHTGLMKHWYRLNDAKEQKIAVIKDNDKRDILKTLCVDKTIDIDVVSIQNWRDAVAFGIEGCLKRNNQLYKSLSFVERRFYNHPSFEYIKFGFKTDGKKLIIILRIQKCNGSKVLRLIDCMGDLELIRSISPAIDQMIKKYDCEYIDCYEANVPDEYFFDAEWLDVSMTDNIIPEYFSPFEQKNVDIYYMTEKDGTILFKGDGDMDRPN